MGQFDVYENPDPETNQEIPYLLDVQTDLLENLATRVVVPLVRIAVTNKTIKLLNPQAIIGPTTICLSTAELAGVSVRRLGKKVGSLKDRRDEIIAALDFLFTGF
jgi:toxin CcdB